MAELRTDAVGGANDDEGQIAVTPSVQMRTARAHITEHVDEHGQRYYANAALGTSGWSKTDVTVATHEEHAIEEIRDQSSGRTYFVHKATGETSWDKQQLEGQWDPTAHQHPPAVMSDGKRRSQPSAATMHAYAGAHAVALAAEEEHAQAEAAMQAVAVETALSVHSLHGISVSPAGSSSVADSSTTPGNSSSSSSGASSPVAHEFDSDDDAAHDLGAEGSTVLAVAPAETSEAVGHTPNGTNDGDVLTTAGAEHVHIELGKSLAMSIQVGQKQVARVVQAVAQGGGDASGVHIDMDAMPVPTDLITDLEGADKDDTNDTQDDVRTPPSLRAALEPNAAVTPAPLGSPPPAAAAAARRIAELEQALEEATEAAALAAEIEREQDSALEEAQSENVKLAQRVAQQEERAAAFERAASSQHAAAEVIRQQQSLEALEAECQGFRQRIMEQEVLNERLEEETRALRSTADSVQEQLEAAQERAVLAQCEVEDARAEKQESIELAERLRVQLAEVQAPGNVVSAAPAAPAVGAEGAGADRVRVSSPSNVAASGDGASDGNRTPPPPLPQEEQGPRALGMQRAAEDDVDQPVADGDGADARDAPAAAPAAEPHPQGVNCGICRIIF